MLIKNFLFHRVSDEKDALWPPMKPVLFEKIVQKLSQTYHIVSLEAYIKDKPAFSKIKKPFATILFDDGYKDNIEYAAPILKKYNCPASFYIVTDSIDRNIPTWTYILDFSLQNTKLPVIELDFNYVPEPYKRIVLNNGISQSTKKLKPWMKTLPNKSRLQIMQTITELCKDVEIPKRQMLSWDEVRQLHSSSFVIGSHTDTHPMLGQLEDKNEIEKELQTSFIKIKNQLGIVPYTISYPIGSYDKRVMELSQKVGYKIGLSVEQRFYKTEKDNLFSIPRVELYQQPWIKVNARISGVYTAIKKLWK